MSAPRRAATERFRNLVARLLPACAAALMVHAAGCCPRNDALTQAEWRLNPPTLPMAQVVAAINANNRRITSLWATLNYSVTIDDQGHTHSVTSDDGTLLYSRPGDFRLNGKKEFIGTVFDMGTDDRLFWLEVVPGTNRLWWGTYAELSRMGPAELPIPIRPDAVLQVLGVATIDPDFLDAAEVPVMRYDRLTDSYVFVFASRGRDNWFARKEIRCDRVTLRPRRVILYDADGRPVLYARLSHDMTVRDPERPAGEGPMIAGDYRLFFPDSGSRMEFTFTDVRLYKSGPGRLRFPNPASFRMPDVSGTDIRSTPITGHDLP